MSYATLSEFQAYVDGFIIDTDDYDVATPEKRTKALALATRAIDRLNFQGYMAAPGQSNQFPRGTDITVPVAIMQATCELALTILAGNDVNTAVEAQVITHEAFLGVKTAKDSNAVQEHIMNGILSYEAWLLLRPFLRPVQPDIVRG